MAEVESTTGLVALSLLTMGSWLVSILHGQVSIGGQRNEYEKKKVKKKIKIKIKIKRDKEDEARKSNGIRLGVIYYTWPMSCWQSMRLTLQLSPFPPLFIAVRLRYQTRI